MSLNNNKISGCFHLLSNNSLQTKTENSQIVKSQIDALTGLRIIAAVYVLFFHIDGHFLQIFLPEVAKYTWMFRGGWMGVDLFFLLSGFIISYNYYESFQNPKGANYATFLIKRLARIYPVHLFTTLVVFIPVMFFFGSKVLAHNYDFVPSHVNYSIIEFVKTVFLVQGWALPTLTSWNAVSWSVSCEWLAYLFFPVIVFMLQPLNTAKKLLVTYVAIFIMVLTIGGLVVLFLTGPSFIGVIRIAAEFTMGVILYRLYVLKPIVPVAEVKMNTLAVIACTIFVFFTAWFEFSFLWVVPFFSWVILAIARKQLTPAFLSTKAFIYGGKISYSLYLCHGVCLVLVTIFFEPKQFVDHAIMDKVIYILSYIVSSIVLTIFSYHAVEEPSRKYIMQWQRSRSQLATQIIK